MAAGPGPADKAIKRLTKELKKLAKDPLPFAEAHPEKDDNMLLWLVKMRGPSGSPYDGGKFLIEIHFSEHYPMKAPELKFRTKIYHPSVSREDNSVCEDILGENWAPVLNIRFILEELHKLLAAPSPDHPLEPEIAEQLSTKPKEFAKEAKKWTKKHAK